MIGQSQLQDETRSIQDFRFDAPYIRDLKINEMFIHLILKRVFVSQMECTSMVFTMPKKISVIVYLLFGACIFPHCIYSVISSSDQKSI